MSSLQNRPFNEREVSENVDQDRLKITYQNKNQTVNLRTRDGLVDKTFHFDYVFDPDTTQDQFFNVCGQPVMDSGKTWSMMGPNDERRKERDLRGLIPRAGESVFEYINQSGTNTEYKILVSYLEIYRDEVQDLLDPTRVKLTIHESPTRGIFVKNLSEVYIRNLQDIYYYLQLGDHHKVMATTDMNKSSSRSHSVYAIKVIQTDRLTGTTVTGVINLVDLAGSEKVRKSGAQGVRLEEAKVINKSLSALGHCINSIVEQAPYIPFRNSKLTRILQNSLGGNSKTTVVCACSPHPFNLEETVSTLGFGVRAKSIKLKVQANIQRSAEELEKLVEALERQLHKEKMKNKRLMQELAKYRELTPEEQEELKKLEAVKKPSEVGYQDGEDEEDGDDMSHVQLQFELKALKCKFDNEVTVVKEEADQQRKLRDEMEAELNLVRKSMDEMSNENQNLHQQENKYEKIKKDFVSKLRYEKEQFFAEKKLFEKENDDLTKKIEELEDKNMRMAEELQAAQGKMISDPKERATYLSQIESLRRNYQDMKEENNVLMEQVDGMEVKNSKTTKELIHIKSEYEDILKDNSRLEEMKKSYEEKMREFDKDISETEEELELLMQENEVFEQENAKMEDESQRLLEKIRGKNVLLTKMKLLMKRYNINLGEIQRIKLKMPHLHEGEDVQSSAAVWENDDHELRGFEESAQAEILGKTLPNMGGVEGGFVSDQKFGSMNIPGKRTGPSGPGSMGSKNMTYGNFVFDGAGLNEGFFNPDGKKNIFSSKDVKVGIDHNGTTVITTDSGDNLYVKKDGTVKLINKDGQERELDMSMTDLVLPGAMKVVVARDGAQTFSLSDGTKVIVKEGIARILTKDGKEQLLRPPSNVQTLKTDDLFVDVEQETGTTSFKTDDGTRVFVFKDGTGKVITKDGKEETFNMKDPESMKKGVFAHDLKLEVDDTGATVFRTEKGSCVRFEKDGQAKVISKDGKETELIIEPDEEKVFVNKSFVNNIRQKDQEIDLLKNDLMLMQRNEVEAKKRLKEAEAKLNKVRRECEGAKKNNKKLHHTVENLKSERDEAVQQKELLSRAERVKMRNLEKEVAVKTEELKMLTEKVDLKTKTLREYKLKVDKRLRELEDDQKGYLIEKEKFIQKAVALEKKSAKPSKGGKSTTGIKGIVNELFGLRLQYKTASTERDRLLRECNHQRRQMNQDRKRLRVSDQKGGIREERIYSLERELKKLRTEQDRNVNQVTEYLKEKEMLLKRINDLQGKLRNAKEFQVLKKGGTGDKAGSFMSNVYSPISLGSSSNQSRRLSSSIDTSSMSFYE